MPGSMESTSCCEVNTLHQTEHILFSFSSDMATNNPIMLLNGQNTVGYNSMASNSHLIGQMEFIY